MKGEGVNFNYFPRKESEKLQIGGGSMVQGQVFLRRGGGGGWLCSYLVFSRFIVCTFTNYFTFCKIVLYI